MPRILSRSPPSAKRRLSPASPHSPTFLASSLRPKRSDQGEVNSWRMSLFLPPLDAGRRGYSHSPRQQQHHHQQHHQPRRQITGVHTRPLFPPTKIYGGRGGEGSQSSTETGSATASPLYSPTTSEASSWASSLPPSPATSGSSGQGGPSSLPAHSAALSDAFFFASRAKAAAPPPADPPPLGLRRNGSSSYGQFVDVTDEF